MPGFRLAALATMSLLSTALLYPQPRSALPTIARADSEWLGAMRARDAARIVAPYDSSGLFITATGTTVRGRDSIAALYRRRFTAIARIVDGGIVRDRVEWVNDSLCYEWGHGNLTFVDTAGATHASRTPYLTVWRRESDGAWRIIRNLTF
jgi:uncharacterized protein (TIGR02246 family)